MQLKIRMGEGLNYANKLDIFSACQSVAIEPLYHKDIKNIPDLLDIIIMLLHQNEKYPKNRNLFVHPDYSRLRPGFYNVLSHMFERYNYKNLTVLDGVNDPSDNSFKLLAIHCPNLEFLRVLPCTTADPSSRPKFTNTGLGYLFGIDVDEPQNMNNEYPKLKGIIGCLRLRRLIVRRIWTASEDPDLKNSMFIPAVTNLVDLIEYDEFCTKTHLHQLKMFHRGKRFKLQVVSYVAYKEDPGIGPALKECFPNLRSLHLERAETLLCDLHALNSSNNELAQLESFSGRLYKVNEFFSLAASKLFSNLSRVKFDCMEYQFELPRRFYVEGVQEYVEAIDQGTDTNHFFNTFLNILGRHCPHLTHVTLRGAMAISSSFQNSLVNDPCENMFSELRFLSLESLLKTAELSHHGRNRQPFFKVNEQLMTQIFKNSTRLESLSFIGNFNNFLNDDFVYKMTDVGAWSELKNLTIFSSGPSSTCLQIRRDCNLPPVLHYGQDFVRLDLNAAALWCILIHCQKLEWLAMDGWRIFQHKVLEAEAELRSHRRPLRIIRRKFCDEDPYMFDSHVISYDHREVQLAQGEQGSLTKMFSEFRM